MTRALFGEPSKKSNFDFDDNFDEEAGPSSADFGENQLVKVSSLAPSKNLDETSTEVTSVKCPKVR